MDHHYLAFDLGAESGRALIGSLGSGRLAIREICRFPNEPVYYNGGLHWDAPRLWLEMERALASTGASGIPPDSIGVDTWGLDYALLGEGGALLENPYHYRDHRTDGVMQAVFERVAPAEIYHRTGIQFMQVNALYQLFAASRRTPRLLEITETLVTMPDLFNFWLTGAAVAEFTNATTTQCFSARTRQWDAELLERLGIPTHFLAPVVEPGSVIGPLAPAVAKKVNLPSVPVVAPACHDTGSAVASIAFNRDAVFISSGTWSLLGTEVQKPVINDEARRLNFTNEGGVCGTFRLLKNIMGLWILQSCRRNWEKQGISLGYGDLVEAARLCSPFAALIDPDDPSFLHPENTPEAIAGFCRQTGQEAPQDPPAVARVVLESLALKYRLVLELLERLTGKRYAEIHIVGGGARNTLLNQLTADATGRTVLAGPVEATALGNIGMQMLATGVMTSLDDVRHLISACFPAERYEPKDTETPDRVYPRFKSYCDSAVGI